MSGITVGEPFPSDVTFIYVPYIAGADVAACGIAQKYDPSKEWADKKVVLFGVPGAFTPGCSEKHLPGFIRNYQEIKNKGVDIIATVATNDHWVMSAWSKANKIENDDILFLADERGENLGQRIGWLQPNGRYHRFAMIVDHGKVTYAEKESKGGQVTVSSAETILSKL